MLHKNEENRKGSDTLCGMHETVIGMNISKRLKKLGMTQRMLADKVGTTEVTISRYVNGERIPKASVMVKIAEVLKTTTTELMGETVSGDPRAMFSQTRLLCKSFQDRWTRAAKLILFLGLMGWDDEEEKVAE